MRRCVPVYRTGELMGLRMGCERAMILGSPGSFSGKRGQPGCRVGSGSADRGTSVSLRVSLERFGRGEKAVAALDQVVQKVYYSRLSRKRGGTNEIELFDNREWNQNVRGELVVARGLQGPWSRVQIPVHIQ